MFSLRLEAIGRGDNLKEIVQDIFSGCWVALGLSLGVTGGASEAPTYTVLDYGCCHSG